jgi:hypothetical protein
MIVAEQKQHKIYTHLPMSSNRYHRKNLMRSESIRA